MPKDHPLTRTERILALLENVGDWCSGEDMSAWLGISRAAIGKHITALKAEGHIIESVTRRGHRLLVKNDPLSVEAVRRHLTTKTLGRGIFRILAETTSTSAEAAALAGQDSQSGAVIVAESQTGGRGRKGHGWFTAPRGLYFSIVLAPPMPDIPLQQLIEDETRRISLAVLAAVHDATGLTPLFKAPNDLMLNGRKLAGMLVEIGLRGPDPDWAVGGIGLNVNALAVDFPPDLRDRATSLYAESGRAFPRNQLLATILNKIEQMRQ